MRIKNFRPHNTFGPRLFSTAWRGPTNRRPGVQHFESEVQNLAQVVKALSAYFKDFTPIDDVYLGLLSPMDLAFAHT